MHCIPGPFGNQRSRKETQEYSNIWDREPQSFSYNTVANPNLLEMFIILGDLEAGDFRQAPSTFNILDTTQGNKAGKYSA